MEKHRDITKKRDFKNKSLDITLLWYTCDSKLLHGNDVEVTLNLLRQLP